MSACEVCGKPAEGEARVCESCMNKTGFSADKPQRREVQPCMRCGGLELIRARIRERTAGAIGDDRNREDFVPLAITYGLSEEYASTFSMRKVPSAAPDRWRPFGRLEAWVCRSCGFVEWYAQQPEDIPIATAHGTELVTVPAPNYRR
jgi:hypothetical protein